MDEDRLRKIEESQAFAERLGDRLHEELLRAVAALEALGRRIERLERRLGTLEEAGEGGESDAADGSAG